MSLKPMEGNIAIAADTTLAMMFKKINQLVADANDSLQADLKMRNKITDLEKEIKGLRKILMNRG